MMPYEATAPWSKTAISGIYRFLKRIWELQAKIKNEKSSIRPVRHPFDIHSASSGQELRTRAQGEQAQDLRNLKNDLSNEDLLQMHVTIKKVGDDLDNLQFNTAVSSLMIWLNYLSAKQTVFTKEYETLLKLLAPFAPHMAQEIWQSINPTASFIHLEKWPQYQANFLNKQKIKIVIQINGKVRDTLEIQSSEINNQNFIENEAKNSQKVKKYLKSEVKKVIYVKGKIINFVV